MSQSPVLYDLTSGVATITLNRPEVMNALNRQLRLDLLAALTRATTEARVIVLTGTGRAFCSGQDLTDAEDPTAIDFEATLRDEYEPLLRAIYDCPLPVISAVNGAAAGAGANLALAADVVIATESASFLQAFTRIGLMPDAGGTFWLPRQIGFARAMGAMLFADKITARQAADWGMIWEAVPDDAFAPTARPAPQRSPMARPLPLAASNRRFAPLPPTRSTRSWHLRACFRHDAERAATLPKVSPPSCKSARPRLWADEHCHGCGKLARTRGKP
jgi:2-(1,2-epoxy-1,2-dihydrophenyl)acetyl-CoA isomerase